MTAPISIRAVFRFLAGDGRLITCCVAVQLLMKWFVIIELCKQV